MELPYILFFYFLLINLIAFALMGIDKSKARRDKWRIPERTLFFSAMLGGSIGALAGMYTFRHKTKHLSFVVGMPAILLVQLTLVYLLFLK